jgi:hypothetical protein
MSHDEPIRTHGGDDRRHPGPLSADAARRGASPRSSKPADVGRIIAAASAAEPVLARLIIDLLPHV